MRVTALRAFVPAGATHWLAAKTRGERRILAALAVVVTLALSWAALWQPLVRDTAAMRAAAAGNSIALAKARRMTEEIGGLSRGPAQAVPPDARAALERILVQKNLRPAVTQLEWQDARARVVFAAVGYEALIAALESLQREAQLRAVDAAVTARVEPGMVRAELTLAR